MPKIVCPNCSRENIFESRSNIPSECSFCFDSLDSSNTISETNENEREVAGLTIIYQITQERLEISALHKTILGRENFGAEYFSKILFNGGKIISRTQCSVEFKNGKFYLLDEGSKHGTFYGINKISCLKNPQVLENNSLIYLGQEPFLIQINYQVLKEVNSSKSIDEKSLMAKAVKLYRCNESGCGYESSTLTSVCPICSTFNSLIPIYE